MSTDARTHTVPAGSDAFDPQGADVALSLSVNDWVLATNATDRASKITALAPTSSRPAIIFQVDTGVAYEATGTSNTLGTDLFVYGGQIVVGTINYAPTGALPWRAPSTQPGQALTLIRQGGYVTLLAGAIENAAALTLPATGQNANALQLPAGFRPAATVIIPGFITNTSASTNTLGSLWVTSTGACTFQTSAAISAAPAGTISVALPNAGWLAVS